MDYTWSQQKSFDEHAMLSYLPLKMRTDIAMRVHYSTLGKVKLFRNCEPGLLKDLVVLLKPIIYLPGDFICRKNDIGKEMFIIQSGQVQVRACSKCILSAVEASEGLPRKIDSIFPTHLSSS
jgi:cyclic nucleotide gated channel beta 1